MLFALFTFIIFVSQLIVFFALILSLLKLDKKINEADDFLNEAKPKIKDISILAHGVSAQFAEITRMWVDNLRNFKDKLILNRLESLISLFLFWGINKRVSRVFRKSKFLKLVFKGLSFVNNMI